MKTFEVRNQRGEPTQAQQHATFTEYVQGERFRFVVTQIVGELPAVTHRASTKRVCYIKPIELAAALGDFEVAGKAALQEVIRDKGAARVRSVLDDAEHP